MSKTSDRRSLLGMTPMAWALIIAILIAAASSGVALTLLTRDRDAAREDVTAIGGEARQLVECVNDPATTQSECEKQADEVTKTIKEVGQPGPAGVPGSPGEPGLNGVDGQDGTDGRDGRTVRGPRGFIGPVGPAGASGSNGKNGADGATVVGPPGPAGPTGATGDTGPAGPKGDTGSSGTDGSNGTDGTDGRGIESITCDPDTQQFVVVYDDGTSQPVEGSDCNADPILTP